MTIGPDPITRTDAMSSRLGIGDPPSGLRGLAVPGFEQVGEAIEEVAGVVWARRRLRVVLDGERLRPAGAVEQPEPLDDAVVQADVADLGRAERRRRRAVEGRVDSEAVVVRGDLDLAGRPVHDRLVDAAVAVLQLVGREAERAPEQLVAEADAEVGDAA